MYSCVEAYDFSNINQHSNEYNLCTEKISVSNNKIHKILTEIEIFAASQSQSSALPIRIQLGTINNIERNKTTVGPRGTSCGTPTMYRNGNFGLVFGRGEILLTYMIFVYHWTS